MYKSQQEATPPVTREDGKVDPEASPRVDSIGISGANEGQHVPNEWEVVSDASSGSPPTAAPAPASGGGEWEIVSEGPPAQSSGNSGQVMAEAGASAQQQPAAAPEYKGNWYLDKVDQFNYAFDRLRLGTLNRIGDGLSAVGKVLPDSVGDALEKGGENINSHNKKELEGIQKNYDETWKKDGGTSSYIAAALGYLGAGTMSLAMTRALPGVGGLGVTGQSTAAGALTGFLDPSDSAMETGIKTVGGGLLGGAVPLAMKGLGSMPRTIGKIVNPSGQAAKDVVDTIKANPGYLNQLKAAETATAKTNSTLSAGEAFPETMGTQEKGLRPDFTTMNEKIVPQVMTQIDKTKTGIKDIINGMADEGDRIKAQDSYNKLKSQYVAPNGSVTDDPAAAGIPENLMQQDYFKDALKGLAGAKSDTLKGVPENSLDQLHTIKSQMTKALDDDKAHYIDSHEHVLTEDQRLGFGEVLDNLNPILQQSEDAVTADKLFQKSAIQDKYLNMFSTTKQSKNPGSSSLNEIRQNLFDDDAVKDQFLKDVVTTGGDPELAKATLYMTDKLSKSSLDRITGMNYAGKKIDDLGVKTPETVYGDVKRGIKDILQSRYTNAVLDLTLNQDKWGPLLKNALNKSTEAAKEKGFTSVLRTVYNNVKAADAMVAAKLGPEAKSVAGATAGMLGGRFFDSPSKGMLSK